MTRRQADVTSLHPLSRCVVVRCPALVTDRAQDRGLHRRTGVVPSKRRSGVENRQTAEAEGIAGGRAVHEDRIAADQRLQRGGVGGPDAHGSASSASSAPSAARRWSPPAGGDQSTWPTGTPCASRSAAKRSSPTLSTRISPPSGPMAAAALEGFGNCGRSLVRRALRV